MEKKYHAFISYSSDSQRCLDIGFPFLLSRTQLNKIFEDSGSAG
jgi:hypothetical protein